MLHNYGEIQRGHEEGNTQGKGFIKKNNDVSHCTGKGGFRKDQFIDTNS